MNGLAQVTSDMAGQIRVLVAEDEALAAMALEDCLLEQGFHVTLAEDGQAALEAASAAPFDVLLTDLRMPRLDGAALIRQLRAARPDLPVVVMSGHAGPSWRSDLHREGEGPIVMLHKPVNLGAIINALRGVVPGGDSGATGAAS
jgi:CheY-like chemotaxis protein